MYRTIIAAMAANGVIGDSHTNTIPWKCTEEMKHFKETTKGTRNAVLMGRKTWESLGSKPLKDRMNFIVSSKLPEGYSPVVVGKSIENIFTIIAHFFLDRIDHMYYIGGRHVYQRILDMNFADFMVLSKMKFDAQGDIFFPQIGPEWELYELEERQSFTIERYKRKRK